jgi:hypothetical protein
VNIGAVRTASHIHPAAPLPDHRQAGGRVDIAAAINVPDNTKLYQLNMSTLLAYMAREGIDDLYQGHEALMADVYRHYEALSFREGLPFDEFIAEKLALKCREFNTRMNNAELEKERQEQEIKAQADAYRKASQGG